MVLLFFIVTVFSVLPTAIALEIGDRAPTLEIDSWVKGQPVASFSHGGVTVVEFWATWCGACLQSIPHLDNLQVTYGDQLVVIGVTADHEEPLEQIRRFVDEMGERMNYRVAHDAGGRSYAQYMGGMNLEVIPTAFLVDRSGRLVWVGHPSELDTPIQLAIDSSGPAEVLLDRARQEASFDERMNQGAWAEALAVAAHHLSADGPDRQYWLKRAIDAHMRLPPDFAAMSSLMNQLTSQSTVPTLLNEVSWAVAVHDTYAQPLAQASVAMAAKAVDLTHSENPDMLDTYARTLYVAGEIKLAVTTQERAVSLAHAEGTTGMYKNRLNVYRRQLQNQEQDIDNDQ